MAQRHVNWVSNMLSYESLNLGIDQGSAFLALRHIMHQSITTVPTPSPQTNPRALAFF